MEEKILLEFSGHYKVKLPIIYHDNYDWLVRVYDNRVTIKRSGVLRPGLQENTTVYFEDVSSIKYGQSKEGCSIRFIMSNLQDDAGSLTMVHKVGKNNAVAFSGSGSEILTPNNISYYLADKGDRLKSYYNEILNIYNKYRNEKSRVGSEKMVIMQESSLDKLKKLKELYDLGILSKTEYEEKRQKMLNEL